MAFGTRIVGIFFISALLASRVSIVIENHADSPDDVFKETIDRPFNETVKILLDEMRSIFEGMGKIIDKAVKKLNNSEYDSLDNDHKWAGIVVNIYSSPDIIENATYKSVYKNLNHEYLSNSTNIWLDFGNLLEKSMEILGEKTFEHLFRGEKFNYPSKLINQPLTKRFYSTSIDPNQTNLFIDDGGIFYHILNATGTDIHNFADIPSEMEVLIKPRQHLNLLCRIRNATDIVFKESQIGSLFPDFRFKHTLKEVAVMQEANSQSRDSEEVYRLCFGKSNQSRDSEEVINNQNSTSGAQTFPKHKRIATFIIPMILACLLWL